MLATSLRLALAAAALLAYAGPPQVFKSGTNMVPIYATATNDKGELIRDLTAADFQIEDNGARQPIALFKNDVQPITIAILLDVSPSLFPASGQAATAVTEFASRLLPGDRACVGTFGHKVVLDPALTGSADELRERLGATAPWPAGTALWDAIEAGRSALDAEGGRRVVLVVTDGADNASRVNPDDTRARLQRDGVMVYAAAVRGRFGMDTSELGALARATGGRTIELGSREDVGLAMRAIADELHHQYVIGFSPARLDGRVHRLDVKVRRPGVTIRARKMYVASAGDAR
jgi:Ca-activated chloride channel family protein